MPRRDPEPRFNPQRPSKRYVALDSMEYELERLKEQARHAERMAEIAIQERDALRTQLLRAGIKPKPFKPKRKRKPPEAGIAVPAVPPNGPLPKQGGAEAPLEFD